MKTLFYCVIVLVMALQACSTKRNSQFSFGGRDFSLEQERIFQNPSMMRNTESVENTHSAQVETIPSPIITTGEDVIKPGILPRFGALKQKLKKVSTVKKLIIDKKNKYSQSSDEDIFAAIIIVCSILLVVVTFWALLKMGVSVLGAILILLILFGLSALLAAAQE